MAKNPKNKKRKAISIAEMLELQSQLIKDHDAIPGKAGYLNWSPELAREWKTKQQLLLKEKKKLEIELNDSKEDEENSGVTPTMGLKAMGAAAAFGDDADMTAAVGLLAAGVGKKIFSGLFKNKKQTQEDKETDNDSPNNGSPEKRESKNNNYTDNDVIISILNKILNAFEDDNERMRRSVRDTEEKQLESDPTADKIGSPEKVKDKKTGMNKLLMLGAIAGLFGSALLFRSAIGEMLSPITDMLGITDPTADADKEDYNFDIMDMLGVTSLLGMLGIGGKVAAQKVATTAAERAAVVGAETGARVLGKTGIAAAEHAANGDAVRAFQRGGGAVAGSAAGAPQKTKIAAKIADAISRLLPKAMVKGLGKSIPFLGAAIGAGLGIYELVKGNYVGAALEVAGGAGSLVTAIPATVANLANDVYKDVYGQYPADDLVAVGKDKVAERMIEIKNSAQEAVTDYLKAKPPEKVESKGAKLSQIEAQGLLQSNKESPLSERDLKLYGGLDRITDIANGGKGDMSAASSAGGAVASGASGGGGTSGGAGASGDFSPTGAPVASSPPPASETSGSAVTAATMDTSKAQNSVTVLPPIVNNESNTMKSGNENASKAQKMTMQVRLNDDVFRKAVDSTAAVLKAA